jgi:hypothetical protein
MEYTDGQVDQYIMDSGKRVNMMGSDTRGILMAHNIMDYGRITKDREMQLLLRMVNYTHANMIKTGV